MRIHISKPKEEMAQAVAKETPELKAEVLKDKSNAKGKKIDNDKAIQENTIASLEAEIMDERKNNATTSTQKEKK